MKLCMQFYIGINLFLYPAACLLLHWALRTPRSRAFFWGPKNDEKLISVKSSEDASGDVCGLSDILWNVLESCLITYDDFCDDWFFIILHHFIDWCEALSSRSPGGARLPKAPSSTLLSRTPLWSMISLAQVHQMKNSRHESPWFLMLFPMVYTPHHQLIGNPWHIGKILPKSWKIVKNRCS